MIHQWLSLVSRHNMASDIVVNIGSGNGLSPVSCQAITWTLADLKAIKPSGTNLSETYIKI